MKKILLIFLFFNITVTYAAEFSTNFSKEAFEQAQRDGKTVVVYSWNKYCITCAKQKPILDKAKDDFNEVLFMYIEHVKHKDLTKYLNISYWSTISVYKNNIQISSAVGLIKKEQIYSLIRKGI